MNEKTLPEGVNSNEKKFLSIEEISVYFGIPKATLYNLAAARKLKHYKPGRRLLFTIEDVTAYILNAQR